MTWGPFWAQAKQHAGLVVGIMTVLCLLSTYPHLFRAKNLIPLQWRPPEVLGFSQILFSAKLTQAKKRKKSICELHRKKKAWFGYSWVRVEGAFSCRAQRGFIDSGCFRTISAPGYHKLTIIWDQRFFFFPFSFKQLAGCISFLSAQLLEKRISVCWKLIAQVFSLDVLLSNGFLHIWAAQLCYGCTPYRLSVIKGRWTKAWCALKTWAESSWKTGSN